MAKKIGSTFISLIMLVSLTSLSVLLIIRTILSGEIIGSLIGNIMNETDGENYIDKVVEPLVSENYQDLSKYFDKEEFEEVIGNYASEVIIYQGKGATGEKPNTGELKKYFQDTISKYEKEHNIDIDTTIVDEIIDNVTQEVAEGDIFQESENEYIKLFFTIVYSNAVIIIIAIIIACLLVIFIINRSIRSTFKYLATVLILNGISIILLGTALNYIFSNIKVDTLDTTIFNMIKNIISKHGLISLVIGLIIIIVLIITSIIFKKIKNNPKGNTLDSNTISSESINQINNSNN